METMLHFAVSAFMIGVVADVWALVLLKPDHILGFISQWAYRLESKITDYDMRERFRYILKPIIGCNRCIAGQIAVWWYMLKWETFDWADFISFVCLTIFFATLFEVHIFQVKNLSGNGKHESAGQNAGRNGSGNAGKTPINTLKPESEGFPGGGI